VVAQGIGLPRREPGRGAAEQALALRGRFEVARADELRARSNGANRMRCAPSMCAAVRSSSSIPARA